MKLHLKEDLTKSDLDIIYKKVYDKFVENSDALGFQKDLVNSVPQLFKRKSTKAAGRCRPVGSSYIIELNPIMLKFGKDGKKFIEDVVAHELVHTLPHCLNHGNEFHRMANKVKRLMGYEIGTSMDDDASEYLYKYLLDDKPNYKLVCDKCKREIPFNRLNNYIKYPEDYKDNCGGSFKSYMLNKDTEEYEEYINKRGFIG